MNFYRAQDEARKQTFWLVLLFSLAVLSLVLLTNLIVAVAVWYSDPSSLLHAQPGVDSKQGFDKLIAIISGLGWAKALWVAGLVCGGIGMAMMFKWASLRAGGAVVAESMGGWQVQPNTRDPREKMLLNVVEEMALASGVPVPPVYLMHAEGGINAFAAGLGLKDAVIGVSRGTMESLNREQLQGVIAHEFSHILNGDMRLNLKIVAVLHGILMIGEAGRTLFRFSSRSHMYASSRRNSKNNGAPIVVLGLALMVIGWIGQFFGALIKAAVSRQREYLADASAVQFTRNPDGIGGALRVIGGHHAKSYLHHHHAHELGHLFFAQAFRASWFATHPPLDERIQKVLPRWSGEYLQAEKVMLEPEPKDPMQELSRKLNSAAVSGVAAEAGVATMQGASPVLGEAPADDFVLESQAWHLSEELVNFAHEPLGALALTLVVLLDKDQPVKEKQLEAVTLHAPRAQALIAEAETLVSDLDMEAMLPLVDVLMPALKSLSRKQYASLRALMPLLIQADGRVDLIEWVLFELIRQHADRHFGLSKERKPKYRKPGDAQKHYLIVLSRLVRYGHEDEDAQQKAFHAAANAAGMYTAKLLSSEACGGSKFTRAVHELARCYPLLKPRLLKGLVKAAQSDAQLNSRERVLIETIALIWDCPVLGME